MSQPSSRACPREASGGRGGGGVSGWGGKGTECRSRGSGSQAWCRPGRRVPLCSPAFPASGGCSWEAAGGLCLGSPAPQLLLPQTHAGPSFPLSVCGVRGRLLRFLLLHPSPICHLAPPAPTRPPEQGHHPASSPSPPPPTGPPTPVSPANPPSHFPSGCCPSESPGPGVTSPAKPPCPGVLSAEDEDPRDSGPPRWGGGRPGLPLAQTLLHSAVGFPVCRVLSTRSGRTPALGTNQRPWAGPGASRVKRGHPSLQGRFPNAGGWRAETRHSRPRRQMRGQLPSPGFQRGPATPSTGSFRALPRKWC